MMKLDGKHINEFGYRAYIDHEHPATPDISNKTMKIPGRAGEWDFGAEIGSRSFNLTIRAIDMDDNLLQQKQNEFIAYLFDAYGKPRNMKLVFDYESDKYYIARVSNSISPSNIAKIIRYNRLPLVAFDPYKYLIVDSDEITWGSTEVVFNSTSIPFGHLGIGIQQITQPQTITFQGLGLAVIPKITISGNARGLILRANDKSMSFPNFNNETWIIDGTDFTVKRNGVDVFLDNIDFLEFFKGENELQISGSNLNFSLSVKFKDKFN